MFKFSHHFDVYLLQFNFPISPDLLFESNKDLRVKWSIWKIFQNIFFWVGKTHLKAEISSTPIQLMIYHLFRLERDVEILKGSNGSSTVVLKSPISSLPTNAWLYQTICFEIFTTQSSKSSILFLYKTLERKNHC